MAVQSSVLSGANSAVAIQTDAALGPLAGSVGCTVVGTFVGTITFQATNDGATWYAIAGHQVALGGVLLPPSTTTTGVGFFVLPVFGSQSVRAIMTSYTSGNASVTLDAAGNTLNTQQFVNQDGCLPSYTASMAQVALITVANFVLQGSATKTIRIKRIKVGPSVATSAAIVDVTGILWSTAPSGGTPGTAPTISKFDSGDAAATAVTSSYTVAPTTGTAIATILDEQLALGTTPAIGNTIEKFFGVHGTRAPVLRGTTQYLAIAASATTSGGKTDIEVDWTEE